MTKFIIFSTQRSGSTLLVNLLDSHPNVLCIGEAFKESDINIAHPEFAYKRYARKSLTNRILNQINRPLLVKKHLNWIYSNRNYSAVGFKLHHVQHIEFPSVMNYVATNNINVIRITRENLLKKHLSSLSAQIRNLYATSKPVKPIKMFIDPQTIIDKLITLENEEISMTEAISKLNYIKIYYESLSKDLQSASAEILDFLNLPSWQLKSSLRKINPDSLENLIENFDEVSSVLLQSKFAGFLQ